MHHLSRLLTLYQQQNGVGNNLHHIVHAPDYVSPTEWSAKWLDLQPQSRFASSHSTSLHPRTMLYPSNTSPGDWYPFWNRPRQVIFHTLLGLRSCSPYVAQASQVYSMDPDNWAAWMDDVMWVFYQVLHQ